MNVYPPFDARSDQRFRVGSPKHPWLSWGLSALVHAACLAILVALLWSVPLRSGEESRAVGIALALVPAPDSQPQYLLEPRDTEIPLASQEASSPKAISDLTEAYPQLANAAPASDLSAIPGFQIEPRPKPNTSGLTAVPDVDEMLNSAGGKASGKASGKGLESSELSEADLERLAQEQARMAALQPVGEPTEISVFGSQPMSGRKFVFLIDQSDSMGSGGLGVLAVSKSELGREIDKLQDYHQFQIIAYNERTTMMRRRKLLPATAENKSHVAEFMEGLVAVSGTNHEGGLMVAVGLEPDVIVWISDGGDPALSANSLAILNRLTQGRIHIHCLQFGIGSQPSQSNSFMQQLAKQNAGRYRYIDVSLWTTNRK